MALDCGGIPREAREWLEAINDLALSAHEGDDITLWDVGR
jgi:hypothetical protein